MRDIIAALLRSRGYTHDDEADPRDRYWYGENLGVRPMLACVAHEMNRDMTTAGKTASGWDTYEVSVAVPSDYPTASAQGTHVGLAAAVSSRASEPVCIIKINQLPYSVDVWRIGGELTGDAVLNLPFPPLRDCDLWLTGNPDRLIQPDDFVAISDGVEFYTAPRFINAGAL